MRYSIWGLLMSCDALWCLVLSLLSARFQHGRLRAAIGGGQLGVAQVSQGILSNNLELYITSNICRISTYNIYIYMYSFILYLQLLLLHNDLIIIIVNTAHWQNHGFVLFQAFFWGDRAASASCSSFTVSTTAFSSWQYDHHHPIWGEGTFDDIFDQAQVWNTQQLSLELGPWTAAREYELTTLKCHDVSLKNGRNGMVFYKFDVCSGCPKKIRKVVPSTLTYPYPHTSPYHPKSHVSWWTLDQQTSRITSNAWSLDYTFSICKANPHRQNIAVTEWRAGG